MTTQRYNAEDIVTDALVADVRAASEPVAIDGLLIDPDTGEVVGSEEPTPAALVTEDEAESAISRMLRARSRLAAATRQRESAMETVATLEAQAVEAALDALKQDPEYVEASSRAVQAERIVVRAKNAVAYLDAVLTGLLAEFARPRLTGRSKSLDMFGGRISFRATPATVAVTDPDAFVSWAQAHGRMDLVKVEPAKSAINKAWVEIAHTEPDGLEPVPESETVTVKFPGLEDAR